MIPSGPGHDPTAIRSQLGRTQPWVRLLSIVGFISAGLMIVVGLIAGAFGLREGQAEALVLLFGYPLLGVLYVYPSLCLQRYAGSIRRFVASAQNADLEAALDAQRSFWKFAGIVTAISLGATIIGMMVAVVVGIVAGVLAR
jgi:hypothetical protein